MDGLHQIVDAGAKFDVGGRTYILSPLRLKDYAEMEQRLIASRPHPLAIVKSHLEGLPEPLQKHLLACAYDDARRGAWVSASELAQWLETAEGKVFWLWLSLRHKQPEITLEAAERLIHEAGLETDAGERPPPCKGEPSLGNSTGQAQTATPLPGARERTSPQSRGAACSVS